MRADSVNDKFGYDRALIQAIIIAIMILIASCDNSDDPATGAPTSNCKLKSTRFAQSGKINDTITFTSENETTYTYDVTGNQIAAATSYDYRTSAGYHQSSSNSRSQEFDNDGFVRRVVLQNSSVNADGSTNFQNADHTYDYEQNRLVKQTVKSTNEGNTTTNVYIFEYDAAGKIVKYYNRDTSAGVLVEYLGSKVVKITYIDEFGNMTNPYVEYNEKGLLVKSILTRFGETEELRYQYNAEGMITRDERYYNTKPEAAAEYEYDAFENPGSLAYHDFKGHPRIPGTRAEPNYKHNIAQLRSFSHGENGQWQLISSSTYAYTYNTKGFPTNVITKFLNKNGVEMSTSSTTYVYTECQ